MRDGIERKEKSLKGREGVKNVLLMIIDDSGLFVWVFCLLVF